MRNDLIARLTAAARFDYGERLPVTTITVRMSEDDYRQVLAALTVQGETAPAQPQDHEWMLNEHPGSPTTWYYCRRCGVVQRADGGNKPCPGKLPPITMRGEPAPAPPFTRRDDVAVPEDATTTRASDTVANQLCRDCRQCLDVQPLRTESIILAALRAVAEARR